MAEEYAAELVCAHCATVAFGVRPGHRPGDRVRPDDLVKLDDRQPDPEDGQAVVCAECGSSAFLARTGDGWLPVRAA